MRGSDKKSRSREAFAAVFEEQTRRFSPFELLGISSDTASSAPPTSLTDKSLPEMSTQGAEEQVKKQAQTLWPDRTTEILRTDRLVEVQGPDYITIDLLRGQNVGNSQETDRQAQTLRPDSQGQTLVPKGSALDQTLDPQQGQTLDPLVL